MAQLSECGLPHEPDLMFVTSEVNSLTREHFKVFGNERKENEAYLLALEEQHRWGRKR